ncbi:Hypothetical protein A7982_04805 [Minicystis rosea]|nr:Hypothetical protein A7982_04805 [Minicystis rosea]
MTRRALVGIIAVVAGCHMPTRNAPSTPAAGDLGPKASGLLFAIAHDIARLSRTCPQLASFEVDRHFDPADARIVYDHHTHASTARGGWSSGVPSPDPDGIWLFIDVHDASSPAQIHTQPVVPRHDLGGGKELMMLILEGTNVTPCAAQIRAIIERHTAEVRF